MCWLSREVFPSFCVLRVKVSLSVQRPSSTFPMLTVRLTSCRWPVAGPCLAPCLATMLMLICSHVKRCPIQMSSIVILRSGAVCSLAVAPLAAFLMLLACALQGRCEF
jgi:hypothetical protein